MYHFIPSVFFCTKQPAERENLLALQKIPPFFAPDVFERLDAVLL